LGEKHSDITERYLENKPQFVMIRSYCVLGTPDDWPVNLYVFFLFCDNCEESNFYDLGALFNSNGYYLRMAPEVFPSMRLITLSKDTMFTSPNMVCLRAQAAVAKSNASISLS